MTSEWLASLGRDRSETPQLYSGEQDAYSEFEEVHGKSSTTKQVNAQIDELTKAVEDEADKIASYYNAASSRKSQQFQDLASITESGVKLKTWYDNFKEASDAYDAWAKTVDLKGINHKDQDELDQDNAEIAENGARVDGARVADQIAKEGGLVEDQIDAKTLFGFLEINIKDRHNLRNVIRKQYPIFRARLHNVKFRIPDGSGGWKEISLADVDPKNASDMKDINYLNAEIDKLFLSHIHTLGLPKGMLKKYIYRPLFKQAQLREETNLIALKTSTKATVLQMEDINLSDKISSGDFNSVVQELEVLAAQSGGEHSFDYQQGVNNLSARIDRLVEGEKISYPQLVALFNDTSITPFKSKKSFKLGDHFKTRADIILKKSRQKHIENLNQTLQERNVEQQTFVLEYENKAAAGNLTFEEAEDAITTYKSTFGTNLVPQALLNLYHNAARSDEDIIRILKMHQANNLIITEELVKQLKTPSTRTEWLKEVGKGLTPSQVYTRDNSIKGAAVDIMATKFPTENIGGTVYANIMNNSTNVYNQAWNDAKASDPNLSGTELHVRAMAAVNKFIAESAGTPNFNKNGTIRNYEDNGSGAAFVTGGSQGQEAEAVLKDIGLVSRLYKDGNLNLDSTEDIKLSVRNGKQRDESLYLDNYAEQIEKNGDFEITDSFYTTFSNSKKMNTKNLIIRRLIATGRISEAEGKKILDNSGLNYKTSGGDVLASMYNDNEIAKVLDVLEIRENKGGFDAAVDRDGTIIEGAAPATAMTLDAVIDGQAKGNQYGMYNIDSEVLLEVVGEISKRDPNFNPAEQVFDAAFQRKVAIINLQIQRRKLQSKNLQSIDWSQHLNIDVSDETHFDDINQVFINSLEILGETKTENKEKVYYPYMRVSTLLPVAVKALAERMSSNK